MDSIIARCGIMSRHLPELLIEHLGTILSVIFLLGGITIISLSYIAGIGQYGLGFAFLCAPLGYTLIRKASKNHGVQTDYFKVQQPGVNLYLILDVCFWALYSISLVILYDMLYFRPWYYFLCVSVAFTILIAQALLIEFKSWNVVFYFFKVILLSLTFRAGRFFAFPAIPGSDTHAHLILAKYILDFGYVPPFEIADMYAFTSLWHIYEAVHMAIFDIGMADSLFILASVTVVATTFLVYVIGKNFFGPRTGLIASLFVSLGDMIFIGTLSNINTSLLVMVYFLVLILCLHYPRKIFHCIAILMVIALFWTHQLSVFTVYLALMGYYTCHKVISSDYFYHICVPVLSKKQSNKPTYLNNFFMLFSSIYMISFWGLIGEDTADENSFFGQMVSRLAGTIRRMIEEYLSSIEPPTTAYENLFSHFDFVDSLLYNLGYSMLFCLALVGALLVLKYWFNRERVSLLFSMGLLFVVVYPGTIIGLDQVFIPHRFLPFLQFICIIFAAFSLVIFYRSAPERISRIILTFFVLAMVFFLITTPYINRNDLLYSKSMESRTEIMLSELAGVSWGQGVSVDNRITVDPHISQRSLSTVEVLHLDPDNITHYMGRDESSLCYIRSHIWENPNIQVRGTFGKMRMVDCSAYLDDITMHHQLVYDNCQVEIYGSRDFSGVST
jgi:hypothetical protein